MITLQFIIGLGKYAVYGIISLWLAPIHPSKSFPATVAAGLLKKNVLAAHELTTELASKPLYADLLFELTLDDGQDVILHIEFQGRSSKPSMAFTLKSTKWTHSRATLYRSPCSHFAFECERLVR